MNLWEAVAFIAANNEKIVIKLGGSVLDNFENIEKASELIYKQFLNGKKIVIVISALKGVTDNLLNLAKKANPNISDAELASILSMGEKISARIFSAALSNKKLKTIVIDTESKYWPIITDDNYLDANPILEETETLIKNNLEPLLNEGYIPIVCGFIGKNKKGEITTLGRGGSDTTAILIGNFINAKEVLFIKDVGAIFSIDPKKVSNAKIVKNLSINEAYLLTSGGAKILQSKALKYVKNGMIIKIIDLSGSELSTISSGEIPELRIETFDKPISMLTIVFEKNIQETSIESLINEIRKMNVEVVLTSFDLNSAILYLAYENSLNEILKKVHYLIIEKGLGKAMSIFEDLIMITIRGSAIETVPGIIDRIIHPLAERKINIYGLATISSSIRLFILKNDFENVLNLIKNVLEVIKNEKD